MKKPMLEEVSIINKYGMTSKQLRESRQYEGAGWPDEFSQGLYLIGCVFMNPHTREEFYWIKVGSSTNLHRRIKEYASLCPMIWKNSYLYRKDMNRARQEETRCHKRLEQICIERGFGSNEWFRVEREAYLNICQMGFSIFGVESDA